MYEQLKSRVSALLVTPRDLKPQTERQLTQYLNEHSTDTAAFLLCAADLLEDYELDILFGPVFTPTLDERAELADLLFHWRPGPEQLRQLVADLSAEDLQATIRLPDGSRAKLPMHEVMIDRFVRLLRFDQAPAPEIAAGLREELSVDLWKLSIALLCERGMSPAHQQWFAHFVAHLKLDRRVMTRSLLECTVEFLASQRSLAWGDLMQSAEALKRATEGTAAFASSGHNYWSADVAQHHHYRGQGQIDTERVRQRQQELEDVTILVDELRSLE